MDFVLVILAAFGSSLLTFFSGFGLGTILLPVFSIFFPLEIAILLTAIVHFLNNIFKTGLMKNHLDYKTILMFGLPAMLGAYFGASLLSTLAQSQEVVYAWGGDDNNRFLVTNLSLIIGGLIFIFAVTEITYSIKNLKGDKKFLIFGGLLSGFFGGLSGHQGALRSVFLLQMGLKKEVFIATGIAIALFIDIVRIGKYTNEFGYQHVIDQAPLLSAGIIAAFAGAILGRKLLQKITIGTIKYIVGITMIVLSIGIITGILAK